MSKRSKSSQRWLHEHMNDHYVKQAQQQGYRSRAAFKLKEINAKYPLFKPGSRVVDLGAAPGGWSQVARELVGAKGMILAVDILSMPEIVGVQFILGDMREDVLINKLIDQLGTNGADVVLSDMAPNFSGVEVVDQARVMTLAEIAMEVALAVLSPTGTLLIKVFQGVGFDPLLQQLRTHFVKVRIIKPNASRARSREVYLLSEGLK